MKSLAILMLAAASLFMKGNSGEEIDYNPILLQKELGTLCNTKDFQLQEMQLPDTVKGYVLNGKFFEILCRGNRISTAYIGRVNSCRSGGCSGQTAPETGNDGEYFDYFILFDTQNRINAIRVYNYEATHGQEITVRGWLKQFIGFDGTDALRVGKEIDSISGATISVNGLVADVQSKSYLLKTFFAF